MKKKASLPLDFKELTPNIQLKPIKLDPLYEKAFLTEDGENRGKQAEYCQNTTTWD